METKQTAINWLIEVLWAPCQGIPSDIIEQAKQMEKEQIVDAHGIKNMGGFKSNGKFFVDEFTGEQYYNETYGKHN